MRAVTPDRARSSSTTAGRPDRRAESGRATLQALRTKIQMVFQDPVSSLSPRMTVMNILSEPLEIHDRGDGVAAARSRR
jgi:peptide/nickel transport system ATP-binding protein